MRGDPTPLDVEYDTLELRVRSRASQPDAAERSTLGVEDDDLVLELELEHRNPQSLGRTSPLRQQLAVFNSRRLLERLSTPKEYGVELGRQLLCSPTAKAYFSNAWSAARGAGRCLRVSLDLEPGSEIERLRWELMELADGIMVGSSQELAFSRFLTPSGQDFRPILPRERKQLRVLVAIATLPADNGRDLAEVDFERELEVVQAALTHILDGQQPRTLGSAAQSFSLDELMSALREGVDILYLVAHGRFGTGKLPEPALLLRDDFDDQRWVRAKELADLVAGLLPEQLPRLVVLASCQGAGDERGQVHASLAGRLVLAGVPAVLGMQGFITVETVRTLMPVLFEELGRDGRIDRALAVARSRARGRPDAWMPALFTRLVDGRLWTQSGAAPGPRKPLRERLQEAYTAKPLPEHLHAPRRCFARESQLQRLLDAVHLAETRGPQSCVVLGDIGTGKTTLVRELIARALADNPKLVAVYSDNASSLLLRSDPYLVIQELLLLLLGDIEDGRPPTELESECITRCRALTLEHADAIVELAPTLLAAMTMRTSCFRRALAAGDEDLGSDDAAAYETSELLAQFSALLSTLASTRPLLLVFENMQWIDRASIAMMADFVRRGANLPITLVTTCRPAELDVDGQEHPFSSMLKTLERSATATLLDLDAISDVDNVALVNELLDAKPNVLGPEFREALYARTKGNPLFTVQLLDALEDRGALVLDEQGRWRVGDNLAWDQIPSGLRATVGERLSHLTQELRHILDVASVDGMTFRVRALTELLERKEQQLLPVLAGQLGERLRLIEDSGRQWVGAQKLAVFRFSHPLVQQYLYDHLSENERRLYHAHVAKLLETLCEGELDEVALMLAHHYQEADEPFDSARFWRMAAARATRLGAAKEAFAHLERGLALLEELPASQRRRPVLQLQLALEIDRAAVLKVLAGWNAEATVAAYERARALAEQIAALAELAPILFGLWAIQLCRPDLRKAAELAARCSEVGAQLQHPGITLQALIARSNTHFWRGEVEESLATAEEALRLFDPVAHGQYLVEYGQDPRSLAYQFLLMSLALLGRGDEALQHRDRMLTTMRALGHPFSLAIGLFDAGWLAWSLRDMDECRRWSTELVELCMPDRYPAYLGLGQMFLAGVDAIQKQAADARARLEQAWRTHVSDMQVAHSIYRSIDAEICWATGDEVGARAAIEDGLRFAESRELHCFRAELLRLDAGFVQREQPERAIALLEQAIQLAHDQHIRLFESRATAQLEALRAGATTPAPESTSS